MNFSEQLISWYSTNKRDLPWRRTKDPYLVWLSEIILQQTRIVQGTPYYERFVTAFPTVRHLAAAEEQEVLKLWQGLGYYSRARNLHATARAIVNEHGGVFPDTHAGIRGLKGIGEYTSAAIASICFDLPHAVMDGNVIRFISRVFGIAESIDLPGTRRMIQAIAAENMDHRDPGDFNQAMMEFGAMVCTPAGPDCPHCPFQGMCAAYNTGRVDEIPARKTKAAVRHRFLHYLVLTIRHKGVGYLYLNKRTGNDIWKNLYDFPSLESNMKNEFNEWPAGAFSALLKSETPVFLGASGPYIHVLTHQKLHARFYRFHSDELVELPYVLVPLDEIHGYPVPKLIDKFLGEGISGCRE